MMKKNVPICCSFFTVIFITCCLLSSCAAVVGVGVVGVATKTIYDRRTIGHQLDDKAIEWRLRQLIAQSEQFSDQNRIRIFSYNDQVLLVGQISSQKERQSLNEIVRKLPMVTKVFNELRVAKPIHLKQISEDTWITSQIKAKFLTDKQLNPLSIRVITENGEVFIVGKMNAEETQKAIDISRYVSGVKTVFHLVEPIKN